MLSSLIDRERRPIWIEFLTLKGKPNSHVWWTKSPTQHFPFLSRSWIGVTLLDYKVRLPCTRMLAAWERSAMFKESEGEVHSPGRSSTLLTDYHISRHVASTFKRLIELPHISTLASLQYTDGVSSTITAHDPARHPYILHCVVNIPFLYHVSSSKLLDFYRS